MVTNGTVSADTLFDALGHGTRREILTLLQAGPLPVGEIAARLPVSRPAVSKHLRTLSAAGLVAFDSAGTRHLFRLDPSGFEAASTYLEGFWASGLDNFKRLIASRNLQ